MLRAACARQRGTRRQRAPDTRRAARSSSENLSAALESARSHGSPRELGYTLNWFYLFRRGSQGFSEVSAATEPTLEELRDLGDRFNLRFALILFGGYLVDHDHLDEGEKLLLEAATISPKYHVLESYLHTDLARLAYKRREFETAETHLKGAYTSALKPSAAYLRAPLLTLWGRVKLALGQPDEAEPLLIEGLKTAWAGKRLVFPVCHALLFLEELRILQGQVKEGVTLLNFPNDFPAMEERDRNGQTFGNG